MQKILRRVATAERVVAKRTKIKREREDRARKHMDRRGPIQMHNTAKTELKYLRDSYRNRWNKGALAHRLDIHTMEGTHGAIGESRYPNLAEISEKRLLARCEWAGGPKRLCLAVSDRVVLLDGPDKGRIGKIAHIDLATASVTVGGLNKANIKLSPESRDAYLSENTPDVTCTELPVPVSAVRLVHPIEDPYTGSVRDVIINRIEPRGLIKDKLTGTRRWDRVVPNLNVSIPWPEKPEPECKEYQSDSIRLHVEEHTFVPTLLGPPMPEKIIDELRNKYSRFRTRHEPDYIAKLEAEEQAKKELQPRLMASMRTPLQEFHRAERERKKKKGKPRLTLEMLEKIGEVIAKNRERALNGAGLSAATDATAVIPPIKRILDAPEVETPPPSQPSA
ncbi:hypothetical protein F5Y16DRAFT_376635 [Xylariaceae sp. FL0255]|nr:hypothetical protein F5Y16DRAFT_376635 [Xylariaceae sp. FL0255]